MEVIGGEKGLAYHDRMTNWAQTNLGLLKEKRSMEDNRGDLVEKYKKKDEVPILEKGIQRAIKAMRSFQLVKGIVMQKMAQEEQRLATMGQRLMATVPKEPGRNLQGMNFPDSAPQPGAGQPQNQTQARPGYDPQIRY